MRLYRDQWRVSGIVPKMPPVDERRGECRARIGGLRCVSPEGRTHPTRLESYTGKLVHAVLRGRGGSNAAELPGLGDITRPCISSDLIHKRA